MTFHAFLIAAGERSTVSSEPWVDIGVDLMDDPKAPKSDSALYAYLKQHPQIEELVDDAWREYLKART